ncbi:MAG: DEAD/DEAH box helicase [Candidatus Aenigmatarchaeota archaeon]
MIRYVNIKKPKKDEKVLALLRPYVREWFKRNFKELLLHQKFAVELIHKGKNTLITAPTGSGKTLASFLSILDYLFTLAEKGKLEDMVYCVYISPLKALDNDIYRNLLVPLKEIREIAKEMKIVLPEVRIAVRTGDTPPNEKQKQLKKPPHILVTTPETIAVVLSTRKFREKFKNVKWVVVDEIHELANSKRGAHLSLSLERLQDFVGKSLVRIGLGATLSPLEAVAKFLVGYENGKERDCTIVDARFVKHMDIKVLSPVKDIVYTPAEKITSEMYNLLHKLINQHRTTLVFTNTRSGTERVVHHLKQTFPETYTEDQIGAHHSSVAREIRLDLEERLKKGLLKTIVCVDKDSEILLSDGKWEKISKLNNDAEIFSLNPQHLNLQKTYFSSINKRNSILNGLYIKTDLGKEIKCSEEHKLLTISDGILKWKKAQDLKKGEFIATIRCIPNNHNFKIPYYIEYLTNENCFVKPTREILTDLKKKLLKKYGTITNAARRLNLNRNLLYNFFNNRCWLKIFVFKKICRDLGNENYLLKLSNIGTNKKKLKLSSPILSPSFLRFLGFFLARGNIYHSKVIVLNKNLYLIKKYSSIIKKEFGIDKEFMKKSGEIIGFRYSSLFASLIKNLCTPEGEETRKTFIPKFIFSLPKNYIVEFLAGYFDGNGNLVIKNGNLSSIDFNATSKSLAYGLNRLLLKIGIVSSIRRGKVSIISGEYITKFVKEIRFFRDNCQELKGIIKTKSISIDRIPQIGKILLNIRKKLKIKSWNFKKEVGIDLESYEKDQHYFNRKTLFRVLNFFEKFGKTEETEYLKKLIKGHVFWEKIKKIEKIKLHEIYDLVDVYKFHNYIVNGIITQNSSTSLELGIDIGYIDLVVQLGSPKSISRLMQRIGRAGHKLHETSIGRVICLDHDDLVETTVMAKKAYEYFLDKIQIPQNCLDVLAQHIMGMSLEKKWNIKEAFNLIRRSYCYRNLEWKDFVSVLEYLSGAYHTLEDKKVYGKIWVDFNDMVFGRRGKYARVIYSLNIGTIPDEVKIKVKSLDGKYIGSIEEEFLQRLVPGDIFVLAGKTYQFVKAKQAQAFVLPVKEKRPTVPSWFSEQLPLSFELAIEIGKFREKMFELINKKSKKEIVNWLLKEYPVTEWAAKAIVDYFYYQKRFLEEMGAKGFPSHERILVENYIDERGNQNLIFHTLYGRRVNDALSRAFAYALIKKIGKSIAVTISDNGFMLSLPNEALENKWLFIKKIKELKPKRIDPKEVVKLVNSENLEEILKKALRQTELLRRKFRHSATRALMVLRNYKGYEIRVTKQQMNADRLIKVCEKIEGFPVLKETYREILQDYMDIEHAKEILKEIEEGKIKLEFLEECDLPSPFSHSLIALGESDVVLMEDRKKILLELHKKVLERVGE